jgi:hypothetical protein
MNTSLRNINGQLPQEEELGTISIVVSSKSHFMEIDFTLLLYKKYFFPSSLIEPEIASNFAS